MRVRKLLEIDSSFRRFSIRRTNLELTGEPAIEKASGDLDIYTIDMYVRLGLRHVNFQFLSFTYKRRDACLPDG